MAEHLARIVGEPVVGRHYMVPCVHGRWSFVERWWPVLGVKHEDARHFNFNYQHYHVDPRFLSAREIGKAPGVYSTFGDVAELHMGVIAKPLAEYAPLHLHGLSRPKLLRRKCRYAAIDMRMFRARAAGKIAAMAAEHPQAIKGRHGWICPHRNFDMRNIAADDEGAITCPMHGLRFCARTGRCLDAPADTVKEAAHG